MTLVVNQHFRTGLVDDSYRYRIDWEEHATALLSALNWDVLDSGAIRRRRGFHRVPNANDADWTSPGGWSSSYNIGLLPFISSGGRRYLVMIEKDPSGTGMTVRVYDTRTQSFETVSPPTITMIQGTRECRDIHYAQVGDSLFFIPADSDTYIEYVFRLYKSSSAFNLEKVQAEGELTGLWTAAAAANYIEPTFLGQYDASGIPISTSAAATNFVTPEDEIATNDQLFFENNWRNVTSVSSGSPYTIEHAAFTHSGHLANAKVRYRYDPSIVDGNAIYASSLTFFEGRLCLGRVMYLRLRGRDFGLESGPTRIRCSRSNDPFLLVPSKYNLYEDSPIDAELASPNMRSITWLAGGRVLYIGGSDGILVVTSGLTPKTIQTVTVDSFGTCTSPPVVEQSGVLYIDRSRNVLVRLRYQDTTDGYLSVAINRRCSEKLRDFKRVVVSGGRVSGPRRVYVLMNNGRIATCGMDEDGNSYGWSVYKIGSEDDTFTVDDICDVGGTLYATVLSSGLGLGTRKLLVQLDSEDTEYVGDFQQTATLTGGDWVVTNAELMNCTVGVIGRVPTQPEDAHLGVFQTTAGGVIQNEQGQSLADLFSLVPGTVKVYRIFESIARPTPAMPRNPDGFGFGRSHRVSKVHIGVVNTRQFVVDGKIVQDPVPLATPHGVERSAITGWLSVEKTGYDVDHDLRIEGSGVYAATVVGLSREVT